LKETLEQLVEVRYIQGQLLSTFIPVTRWGGAGFLSGLGFLVWAMKGRDFGTEKGTFAAGVEYNPYSSEAYFKAL
jgi:hypothetical protein